MKFWGLLVILLGFSVVSKAGGRGIKTGDEKLDRFDDLFEKYGKIYGIDPKMLKIISMIESRIGQNAGIGFDGKSTGIMQIAPNVKLDSNNIHDVKERQIKGTLNGPRPIDDFDDHELSVETAAKLLAYAQKIFGSNKEFVVKSYNQGVRNTANREAQGREGFTRDYWEKYQKFESELFNGGLA